MTAEHRNDKPAEVRLTDETISYLKEEISSAVRIGIQSAINEETAAAFWKAGFNVLQDQATRHAGRFVIGGLAGIFKKIGLFLFLGTVVYTMGGWAALAKLWHVLWSAS